MIPNLNSIPLANGRSIDFWRDAGKVGRGEVEEVGELAPGLLGERERVEDELLGREAPHPALRVAHDRAREAPDRLLARELRDARPEGPCARTVPAPGLHESSQTALYSCTLPARVEELERGEDLRQLEERRVRRRERVDERVVVPRPRGREHAGPARARQLDAVVQEQEQHAHVRAAVRAQERVVRAQRRRGVREEAPRRGHDALGRLWGAGGRWSPGRGPRVVGRDAVAVLRERAHVVRGRAAVALQERDRAVHVVVAHGQDGRNRVVVQLRPKVRLDPAHCCTVVAHRVSVLQSLFVHNSFLLEGVWKMIQKKAEMRGRV